MNSIKPQEPTLKGLVATALRRRFQRAQLYSSVLSLNSNYSHFFSYTVGLFKQKLFSERECMVIGRELILRDTPPELLARIEMRNPVRFFFMCPSDNGHRLTPLGSQLLLRETEEIWETIWRETCARHEMSSGKIENEAAEAGTVVTHRALYLKWVRAQRELMERSKQRLKEQQEERARATKAPTQVVARSVAAMIGKQRWGSGPMKPLVKLRAQVRSTMASNGSLHSSSSAFRGHVAAAAPYPAPNVRPAARGGPVISPLSAPLASAPRQQSTGPPASGLGCAAGSNPSSRPAAGASSSQQPRKSFAPPDLPPMAAMRDRRQPMLVAGIPSAPPPPPLPLSKVPIALRKPPPMFLSTRTEQVPSKPTVNEIRTPSQALEDHVRAVLLGRKSGSAAVSSSSSSPPVPPRGGNGFLSRLGLK
ncbi:hypothetical protein BC828DRAFT_371911 [Blastocladiella britannica]|nr:hypothetical protein BC828DRAFT_371911 [Blastocladiella britannica]